MVDPNHSLWLPASHLPALRLPMILTKTSTKTEKSSFSQKRLISLSPHLIFRTTPFNFVTYSPFCNLFGLQYTLQREQLRPSPRYARLDDVVIKHNYSIKTHVFADVNVAHCIRTLRADRSYHAQLDGS